MKPNPETVAQIDWGSAPAWGSVVVAFVALIFAGLGARAAIRGNRNQQKQIEYQQVQLDILNDDRQKSQASKVAAWIHRTERTHRTSRIGISAGPVYDYYIRVTNGSDLPVYAVIIEIQPWEATISESAAFDPFQIDVAPPGVTDIELDEATEYMPRIHFEDAAGRFWLRDYRGALTEIEHADVLPLLQTAEWVNDRIRT